MEILIWIAEGEIVQSLNFEPPNTKAYARFLGRFAQCQNSDVPTGTVRALLERWLGEINPQLSDRHECFLQNYLASARFLRPPAVPVGGRWNLPKAISREESQPFRAALTSAHLRHYVDEWLKTGLRRDGSEYVRERDLTKTPHAGMAFRDYLDKARPGWTSAPNPLGVQLVIARPSDYHDHVPDFFEAQIVKAKRLFAGMMLSDWKDRVCKCRFLRCGRYFIHPKPRDRYKHGIFCNAKCARSAAAVASMGLSRSRGRERLVEAAARKLGDWRVAGPEWQDDSDRKRRLVEHLCILIARERLHGYKQEVKVNWVTRHKRAIEQQRERLVTLR